MIFLFSLLVFVFWFVQALDLIPGVLFGIPVLKKKSVFSPPEPLPKISIIFAARNEAAHVREALASTLAQDYPDFEVIAVNDRSSDGTLVELEKFQGDSHLRILNVTELPKGWLGKNHALWKGAEAANGAWLVFTDADVIFDPTTLSRTVETMRERNLNHLTLFPHLITKTWIEEFFATSFLFAFLRRYRPWAAKNQRSRAFIGIGAFNFLRREVYEKIGTHKTLALDLLDDMHLGRAIKYAGFHQMAMNGTELVRTRWVEGWKGVTGSLQKNAFAGLHFRFSELLFVTVAALVSDVLPYGLIFLAQGPALGLSLCALALIFFSCLAVAKFNLKFLLQFPLQPLASLLLMAIVWRSALTALGEGGIRWRETFYSLDELKKGKNQMVPGTFLSPKRQKGTWYLLA